MLNLTYWKGVHDKKNPLFFQNKTSQKLHQFIFNMYPLKCIWFSSQLLSDGRPTEILGFETEPMQHNSANTRAIVCFYYYWLPINVSHNSLFLKLTSQITHDLSYQKAVSVSVFKGVDILYTSLTPFTLN